jgi:hypothetical protein
MISELIPVLILYHIPVPTRYTQRPIFCTLQNTFITYVWRRHACKMMIYMKKRRHTGTLHVKIDILGGSHLDWPRIAQTNGGKIPAPPFLTRLPCLLCVTHAPHTIGTYIYIWKIQVIKTVLHALLDHTTIPVPVPTVYQYMSDKNGTSTRNCLDQINNC